MAPTRTRRAKISGLVGQHVGIGSHSAALASRSLCKFDFSLFISTSIPDKYAILVLDKPKKELKTLLHSPSTELEGYTLDSLSNIQKELSLRHPVNLVKKKPLTRAKGKDPLSDDYFWDLHEKWGREEKRFVDSEKNSLLSEVEDYVELLSLLGLVVRMKNLQSDLAHIKTDTSTLTNDTIDRICTIITIITKIDNVEDIDELLLKYRLTVNEIRTFLLAYIRNKKINDFLKKEYHQYWDGNSIDENNSIETPIGKIKAKRQQLHQQKFGPIQTIKFTDVGLQLDSDPIFGVSIKRIAIKEKKMPTTTSVNTKTGKSIKKRRKRKW